MFNLFDSDGGGSLSLAELADIMPTPICHESHIWSKNSTDGKAPDGAPPE